MSVVPRAFVLPLNRPFPQTLFVAYSGGKDSTVLLHQLNKQLKGSHCQVRAIHTNHHLQAEASQWQQHCADFCQQHQIPLHIISARVFQEKRKGLERCAREARFAAFTEFLPAQALLALAHHQRDQAETVLIQVLRGGGVEALSGMQEWTTYQHFWLWRPMLNIDSVEINQYAQANQLSWIEDKSNEDRTIRRNFLRKQIFPELEKNWQSVHKRLSNSAKWAYDESQTLSYFLHKQLQKHQQTPPSFALYRLDKTGFESLPPEASLLLLKELLKKWGIRRLKSHLQEINRAIQENLLCEHILASQETKIVLCLREKTIDIYPWVTPRATNIALKEHMFVVTGEGISLAWMHKNALSLSARLGGERVLDNGKNLKLKTWYKQHKIPLCWRKLPLLYAGEVLVGIWGLRLFDVVKAEKGDQGVVFDWQIKE